MTHVTYRGTAQSVIDLMEGRIELLMGTIAPSLPHIREGKMRALATTGRSATRSCPTCRLSPSRVSPATRRGCGPPLCCRPRHRRLSSSGSTARRSPWSIARDARGARQAGRGGANGVAARTWPRSSATTCSAGARSSARRDSAGSDGGNDHERRRRSRHRGRGRRISAPSERAAAGAPLPAEGQPRAALVSLHGGRWTRETRLTNAVIDEALARDGALVMALDIRMPPVGALSRLRCRHQFRGPLAQTRARGGRATDNVGGIGTSSGGHQMMLRAMRPRDPRYAALPVPRCRRLARLRHRLLAGARSAGALQDGESQGHGRPRRRPPCLLAGRGGTGRGQSADDPRPGERMELPPTLLIQGTGDVILPTGMADKFAAAYPRPAAHGAAQVRWPAAHLHHQGARGAGLARSHRSDQGLRPQAHWPIARRQFLRFLAGSPLLTATSAGAIANLLAASSHQALAQSYDVLRGAEERSARTASSPRRAMRWTSSSSSRRRRRPCSTRARRRTGAISRAAWTAT